MEGFTLTATDGRPWRAAAAVTPAVAFRQVARTRSLRNGNDPVQNVTLARLRAAAGPGSRARAASFQNLTPGHGTDPPVTGRFRALAKSPPPYVVSSTPPHGASSSESDPSSGQAMVCGELPARHRSMSRSPIGRWLDDDDDGDTCTWRGKLLFYYYYAVIIMIIIPFFAWNYDYYSKRTSSIMVVLCCCESTPLAC